MFDVISYWHTCLQVIIEAMDSPHHRKIELQSPADLTYLLSNVRASAQSKLDSAFPPSAAPKGEEDALRGKVEELIQEVCPPDQTPICI